jgi:GntR family transcriptional regulator, transcriptional repressor for pyruvate dehydrogenase complex
VNFKAIRKSSAPEMVAEQILGQIQSGDLAPGDRLPPQRELAELLGVGRSSVREAINALAVMGYLDVAQGRGTYITVDLPDADVSLAQLDAALKAGSILELMDVRELLECRSARLAAERAEGKSLKHLETAIGSMRRCDTDYASFLEADIQFHQALAEASENQILCELTRLILDKVVAHHLQLRTTRLSPGYRQISIETAEKILAAVAGGDGDAAAQWTGRHLNAIKGELKDILE